MLQDKILLSELKKRKLVPEADLDGLAQEARRRGKSVEEMITSSQLLRIDEFLKLKSEILKTPYRIFEPKEEIPKNVMTLIPEETARNYRIIPFDLKDGQLYIGAVDPDDERLEGILKFITQRNNVQTKLFLISFDDFSRLADQYRSFQEEVQEAIKSFRSIKPSQERRVIALESSQIVSGEDAPIIKLMASFLKRAVKIGASDIHIEPLSDKLRIRFRAEGDLGSVALLPLDMAPALISRVKILSDLKIDETRIPQDGRFRSVIDGKEIDFRVSTFPTANGEKVAIRILDPSVGLLDLKDLGMNEYNVKKVEEAIERPYGMILITGPTGSGKTTMLYAILRILNKDDVNILSLEDPVEYRIDGINQSQVMPEIGYSFASGLRQAVRQDPDIILVGEIRDQETAELGVHAALTGHLLFATLHTNDAVGVIPRLLDMGVQRYLLPPTVLLMEAQRLIRKLCQNCKKPKDPSAEVLAQIKAAVADLSPEIKAQYNIKEPYKVYYAEGCERCGKRGSVGRIGMHEIFMATEQLKELLLSNPSEATLRAEAKRQKMVTMRQDGVIKALNGIVAIEEVLRETI